MTAPSSRSTEFLAHGTNTLELGKALTYAWMGRVLARQDLGKLPPQYAPLVGDLKKISEEHKQKKALRERRLAEIKSARLADVVGECAVGALNVFANSKWGTRFKFGRGNILTGGLLLVHHMFSAWRENTERANTHHAWHVRHNHTANKAAAVLEFLKPELDKLDRGK